MMRHMTHREGLKLTAVNFSVGAFRPRDNISGSLAAAI